ncbi:MAG: dienelactone hydrolase [Verrucomicrobiales bacterium]|jgi:dienelactone hydrolase
MNRVLIFFILGALAPFSATAQNPKPLPWNDLGNDELERYFERRVAELENPMAGIETLADWQATAPKLRQQLLEMLGLDPMPEKTDLKATVTRKIEREQLGFTVENLHFQSRPGLYVTGNLYLPKNPKGKVPAILYVCGHGSKVIDGVSYGNKTSYHHHGAWFAQNGYACLTIDTLQMGEIEGIHHGTYKYDRWSWISRGYTSAGVEAWNCVRALDYLQSRPEIDGEKLGVTGRSGGGAYSWWISTIDERIKCAVPVAGIASLRNHVIDGCVEGHCDCMFQVNTYAWDYGQLAALVAPRPLLISNTDNDRIFPLDGVVDVYNQARRIYELHEGPKAIGLNIEEGPHTDTQPLRTSAFHWFNRHFKGTALKDTYSLAATPFFEPQELKVFQQLPEDELNTTIDESFVPLAPEPTAPMQPKDSETWMAALKEKVFLNWNDEAEPLLKQTHSSSKDGLHLEAFELTTEPDVTCPLYLVHRDGVKLEELQLVVLNVLDHDDWNDFIKGIPTQFPDAFPGVDLPETDAEQLDAEKQMHESFEWGMAYLCPRGIGPNAWPDSKRKQTQIRRRFVLVGQTRDGQRVFDIRQAIRALRVHGVEDTPLWMQAAGDMAGNALYASLFVDKPVATLDLHRLPTSHLDGPAYLNVLRFLDMPQAAAMAAQRSKLRIYTADENAWAYLSESAPEDGRVQLRKPMAEKPKED